MSNEAKPVMKVSLTNGSQVQAFKLVNQKYEGVGPIT